MNPDIHSERIQAAKAITASSTPSIASTSYDHSEIVCGTSPVNHPASKKRMAPDSGTMMRVHPGVKMSKADARHLLVPLHHRSPATNAAATAAAAAGGSPPSSGRKGEWKAFTDKLADLRRRQEERRLIMPILSSTKPQPHSTTAPRFVISDGQLVQVSRLLWLKDFSSQWDNFSFKFRMRFMG